MEINKDQLNQSLKYFQDESLKNQLNQLYDQIPSGVCSGCAKCCTESVQAFYVEFLNIFQYMKTHNIYDQLNEKIENHYFSELYKRQDCPFLNSDKGCSIYPVRPMVCRMFGHSSKKDHEASYQGILEMNEEADAYFFETYQKHIPDEVKFHKIDYCQSFKPSKVMSKSSRQELIDHLFQLDTQFLFEDLIPEDAINLSITNWFIYLKYSEEEASEKRIKMFLENCK